MAKTDIANLNVRLTANTSEFTAGMANAQRRLEQTTAVVTKSRAAFSGLGAAMKMPSFGRGAALGGAASGVLGAMGLGALGGGVAGLLGTAAFIGISALTDSMREANEAAKRAAESQIAYAAAMRDSAAKTQEMIRQIAVESDPRPELAAREESARSTNASRTAELNARIAAILADNGVSGLERDEFLKALQRNPSILSNGDARRALMAENARFQRAIELLAMQAGRTSLTGMPSPLTELRDIQLALINQQQVFASTMEQLSRERQKSDQEGNQILERIDRTLTNLSGPLASTVGRLSSQVEQILNQR